LIVIDCKIGLHSAEPTKRPVTYCTADNRQFFMIFSCSCKL